jgi:hypothetical protein
MNAIRAYITVETIVQALGFPDGTKIRRIDFAQDKYVEGVYQMIIEHPELPEVRDGEVIHVAYPIFMSEVIDDKHTQTTLHDWGIK